jgi:diaminopimelate decarboxylase
MRPLSRCIEIDDSGLLRIGGVKATDLARDYGTPLFVISERTIRENYRAIRDAFQNRYASEVIVCVGMKANWGLAARRVIVEEGGGGEAFGSGELYVALLAGTPPERIVLNGPNKSDETLIAAINARAMINVDNMSELSDIERVARSLDKVASVLLRIRLPLRALSGRRFIDPRYGPPGIDIMAWGQAYKFGMEPDSFFEAVKRALSTNNIDLRGMMYHGGFPRRAGYFREETEELMDYVIESKVRCDWQPEYLNIGGGFLPPRHGIDPEPPSIDICAEEITATIARRVRRHGVAKPKLILEPGRYCWESAIVWLTRVGIVKKDRTLAGKTWVYVDGSTNDLRDPFDPYQRYHEMIVANDVKRAKTETVDICGGLCNADDILAERRECPILEPGDLLAFLDMGAYKESFANQHNVVPRSASVMVSNGRTAIVRRRETIQDVLAREIIPHWLLVGRPGNN